MKAQKIGLGFLFLMMAAVIGLVIYGVIQASSQPAHPAGATAVLTKMVATPSLPATRTVSVAPGIVKATQAPAASQTTGSAELPVWLQWVIYWVIVVVFGLMGLGLLWLLLRYVVWNLIKIIWRLSKHFWFIFAVLLMDLVFAVFFPDANKVLFAKNGLTIFAYVGIFFLVLLLLWIFHKIRQHYRNSREEKKRRENRLWVEEKRAREERDKPHCPHCGSTHIGGGSVENWNGDSEFFYYCHNCGRSW